MERCRQSRVVVLESSTWTRVRLEYSFWWLGLELGLEDQGLGLGLGLEAQGLGLVTCDCVTCNFQNSTNELQSLQKCGFTLWHCRRIGLHNFHRAVISCWLTLTRQDLPILFQLAMKMHTVPASSAPVERVFSHGGLIMRPHRNRLSDTMLSNLVFLKCNNLANDF